MNAIAVYCGSSKGRNPIYTETAKNLGRVLSEKGIKVVYGAGNVGLMGELANATLEHKGYIIGVIPYFLKELEVCHTGLTELLVTETMDERKVKMVALSEGTIILPGGYGTMDELFELLTLVQLKQERQAIGILNVNGYYDPLLQQVKLMHQEGFLREAHLNMMVVSDDAADLIEKMEAYEPDQLDKWI